MNISVPDSLAEQVREQGIPISAICQRALRAEVSKSLPKGQPALVSFIRPDGSESAEYLVLPDADGGSSVVIPEGCTGASVRSVPVWPQDYPTAEHGWGGGVGAAIWSGTVGVPVRPGE